MSKTNSMPDFHSPFYKKEEKLFFNHFSSSVFYTSITTELDFFGISRYRIFEIAKTVREKVAGGGQNARNYFV